MLIDFNNMEEKAIPNFKGGEKQYDVKMFDHEANKIMHGRLVPGASIGYHTHVDNCEIIYILSGHGTCIGDKEKGEEAIPVNPGEAHYCPKGFSHSLVNTGDEDLIFFAVVAG